MNRACRFTTAFTISVILCSSGLAADDVPGLVARELGRNLPNRCVEPVRQPLRARAEFVRLFGCEADAVDWIVRAD